MKSINTMPLCAAGMGFAAYLPMAGGEGFVDDSKASVEMRNFYMSRDFREGSGQSKRQEWAQGFVLRYESGFTPGVVGFGVDAIGMLGIKLDSGPGRSGTGLLPVQDDGDAPDNYSKAGGTLKLRVSNSLLRVGTLLPKWPTLVANNGRLLPQTFEGAQVQVNEWKPLEFTAARIQGTVHRDQSGSTGLELNNKNRRFSGPLDGGDFNLFGGTFHAGEATNLVAQYAVLEDVYKQTFLGLTDRRKGDWGTFTSDVRFFDSDSDGQERGGRIDNRAFGALGTYKRKGHSFGLGYQTMSGDSAFPYVDGTDPYLVNFVQVGDFAEKSERSWQARYDFDLGTLGVPGLTFMTRYLRGSRADVPGADSDAERELDVELQYVVQSGSMKGLSMRVRSATYRADFARDADDVRVIVSYPLSLL